jgi:hypothetical protein
MTTPITEPIKSGWKTSEFWVATLGSQGLAVAALVFHRDLSGYVPAAALAAAGIAAAVYAAGRAHLKRPVDLPSVVFDVEALVPILKKAVEAALAAHQALPTLASPPPAVLVKKAPGKRPVKTVVPPPQVTS